MNLFLFSLSDNFIVWMISELKINIRLGIKNGFDKKQFSISRQVVNVILIDGD